jgi:outer membrane lipoprotein SlyB
MIGGALGFVVGAVAGGIAGGAIYHDAQKKCDDPLCEIFTTPRIGTAAGAYGGGALGLVTGAIVGSLVKNERWVDAEGLGSRK